MTIIADTLPLAQPRIRHAGIRAHRDFLNSDGTVLMPGQDLLQPDLAITLRAIAQRRTERISTKVRSLTRSPPPCVKAGGIMTTEDTEEYTVRYCASRCAGLIAATTLFPMPPPSSGGVHLIEMLNILEGYDLAKLSREESLHVIDRGHEARLRGSRRRSWATPIL